MAESVRRRRSFPDAFKLEAVAAVRGGRAVSQVAAELGLVFPRFRGHCYAVEAASWNVAAICSGVM